MGRQALSQRTKRLAKFGTFAPLFLYFLARFNFIFPSPPLSSLFMYAREPGTA